MPYPPRNVEQRFWSKVSRKDPEECWIWSASKQPSGYGQFGCERSLIGIEQPGYTMTGAHKVAWILTNGAIPGGLYVLHKCDNPPCCNPNHLFLGTQIDNMQDCLKKGRHGHGTTGAKKHSPEMIRAAVDDYATSHDPVTKIAIRHGIAESHLRRLIEKHGHVIQRQYRKIDPQKAKEIRQLYGTGSYTYFDLASKFDVSFSMIDRVVNLKNVT